MTLADLLTELAARGAMKPSRVPAMKTSLKYLASALGHASPEACPADAACREEATWATALEDRWRTLETQGRRISAYTRRNVRNDIRKIFTLAAANGLLQAPLPPILVKAPQRRAFEREHWKTNPYQATYRPQTGPRHFGLRQAQWPPDIQDGWRNYQARCGLRVRETTFQTYLRLLETYLGYLANICGRTPTWSDVFDVAQLTEFVRWHAARVARSLSTLGRQLVISIAAIAKTIQHSHERELGDFAATLKPPLPLHTKRAHWVSLATLEAVAEDCLREARVPVVSTRGIRSPGLSRTTRFQTGLMLKFLVRIPLRQRNLREARLEHNLYQDQAGHWQLSFRGDELKIGTRGGRVNEFNLDLSEYCPDLILALQEFLQVYRPRIPGAATSPLLFLTKHGNPFAQDTLHDEIASAVAMRTGQRFYPHLIRTIWATEYLEKTQDFTTAATMLGDALGTVMRTYYDVVNKNQHAKAKAFLGTALQG
jgi:hypothetical protein